MVQWKRWIARVAALVALLGAGVAVYVAVASVDTAGDEVTSEQVATRLNAANREASRLLEELRAGESPRPAQDAVRAAADTTRELIEETDDGGVTDHIDAVLQAELTYLDAVGSTLNNPRSALKGAIGERALALRRQLESFPGGDSTLVHGGQELVVYSDARLG